jgi:tetratricopeptide (TPR) repeat protein
VTSGRQDESPATAALLRIAVEWLERGLARSRHGHDRARAEFEESHSRFRTALDSALTDDHASIRQRVEAHIGLAETSLALAEMEDAQRHWRAALETTPHDHDTLVLLSNRMRAIAGRHGALGHDDARGIGNGLAEEALDGGHIWREGQARGAYRRAIERLAKRDVLGGERLLHLARQEFQIVAAAGGAAEPGVQRLRVVGRVGLTATAVALGDHDDATRQFEALMDVADPPSLGVVASAMADAARACGERDDHCGEALALRCALVASSAVAARMEVSGREARRRLHDGIGLLATAEEPGLASIAKAASAFRKMARTAAASTDRLAARYAGLEASLGLTVASIACGAFGEAQRRWNEATAWVGQPGPDDGWVRAWEVMDRAGAHLHDVGRTEEARVAERFAHRCFPTSGVREARAAAARSRAGARR